MPVSGDEVETCPDCGCPQQEWRSRKHVSTCPRAVTKGRDADGLRLLIRACLRELDEEREAVREGVSAVDLVITDRCVTDEEQSEVARKRDTLRSLLPETEGEA